MYQWCEFKSCRGKNKNLTALKSNSNTVWFNFQTYIYILYYFFTDLNSKTNDDVNTSGLTNNAILLIVSSSISGLLLGLAIIVLGLCIISIKFQKVQSPRRRRHRRYREPRETIFAWVLNCFIPMRQSNIFFIYVMKGPCPWCSTTYISVPLTNASDNQIIFHNSWG